MTVACQDPPVRTSSTAVPGLAGNITLYWLTNTGIFTARLYWENKADFFNAKNISIPYAMSIFPDELYQAPRSWAERAYPRNLIHYNRLAGAATLPPGNSQTCSPAKCGPRSARCVKRG
jgi:hypothetical protein